jgi:hypothetical protein
MKFVIKYPAIASLPKRILEEVKRHPRITTVDLIERLGLENKKNPQHWKFWIELNYLIINHKIRATEVSGTVEYQIR